MPDSSKKPTTYVRLHTRGGETFGFDDLDRLAAWIPRGISGVLMLRAFGERFDRAPWPFETEGGVRYVVRDLWGDPVPPAELAARWRARNGRPDPDRPFRGRFGTPGRDYAYRAGPVPGTACHRGGGHLFRRPGTTGERRAWDAARDDDGAPVACRRRRSAANLPEAWDDIPRGDRQRSWKAHRKTQYRPK